MRINDAPCFAQKENRISLISFYRILYAYDPKRVALLLIGGNKAGKNRWLPVEVIFYLQFMKKS